MIKTKGNLGQKGNNKEKEDLTKKMKAVKVENEPVNMWYDIPEFDGKYQISRTGDVRKVHKSGKVSIQTKFSRKNTRNLYVKLTKDGKSKDYKILTLMIKTFYGKVPKGKVPYHKNLIPYDDHVNNIGFTTREKLGKMTGAMSRKKAVVKINTQGEMVETYKSAREAGRKNNMSYQTVLDRCHGKVKDAFALDGHNYKFEDEIQ